MSMPIYRVFNKVLNAWGELYADSSPHVCAALGWDVDVCWVREYSAAGGWKKPVDCPELGEMKRRVFK